MLKAGKGFSDIGLEYECEGNGLYYLFLEFNTNINIFLNGTEYLYLYRFLECREKSKISRFISALGEFELKIGVEHCFKNLQFLFCLSTQSSNRKSSKDKVIFPLIF